MEPQKFGRYEIRGEIGRGGMATVYHAYDPRFGREVAIKVLPREMLHDVQFRARFEREARTIAMLEHPAIVPVYDFGEKAGQPYFVMRYMTGGSLSDRMKKGPVTVAEAARIIAHIAPGLDEAHTLGIIHRDMKPGNILFDQFNEPYISDFGIAKISEAQTTMTGSSIMGTPAYMSPEQAQGERIDRRSDIYSLGVILFEMLTGQQPYHGDTPMSVVVKQITEPVPNILDFRPDLPPDIGFIIKKAMTKDRNERFQDVISLATALTTVARGGRLSLESPAADKVAAPDSAILASPEATILATPTKESVAIAPVQPVPGTVAAKEVQVPQVGMPGEGPAAQPRKAGRWIGLVVGLLLLFAVVGGIFLFRNKLPFLAAPLPTPTQTLARATSTPSVALLTATTAALNLPAATNTPAPTDTPAPSPTATIPGLPSLGGADLIAFLNKKDIWVIGVDGKGLQQLTKDGIGKHDLQWAPDGKSVFYINEECIQSVTFPEGVISSVTCFTSAKSLDDFEISPDGSYVGLSVNHNLFLVPLDVTALSKITDVDQLALMPGGLIKYPDLIKQHAVKQVRWLKDGKRIAVNALSPNKNNQIVDAIVIYDTSSCTSSTPCNADTFYTNDLKDIFPGERFTMAGYGIGGGKNSTIPSFDLNSEGLFLLNSVVVNNYFGFVYSYNSADFLGEQVEPVVTTQHTKCCYTDLGWSPDDMYVIFSFQNLEVRPLPRNELYYIPYDSLGSGGKITPVPLPDDMLTNVTERLEPALRRVK